MRHRFWVGVGASIVLGLIFVAAGVGKLLHQVEAFSIPFYFPDFLTPALAKAIHIWLPRIELIVGLLLIIGIAAKFTSVFSLVLIAGFIASNSWLLSQGLGNEPCGCFGMAERIAQVKLLVIDSLYFDIGMLGLALLTLIYYPSKFFTLRPWFLRTRMANDSMGRKVG